MTRSPRRGTSPLAFWTAGMAMTRMAGEAQMVIGMRMLGMAGLWTVSPGENARMVSEKQTAFLDSGAAAMKAALSGRGAAGVMQAATAPLKRKTGANLRRLARGGPKLPGG